MLQNEEAYLRAFAERLKELRKAKGITQERLSELSGLDLSHIARMETAQRNPRLTTLIELAKAFNITLSELMKFSLPKEK